MSMGDTVSNIEDVTPIESSKISPPTISMNFSVNDSPFAGLDGLVRQHMGIKILVKFRSTNLRNFNIKIFFLVVFDAF